MGEISHMRSIIVMLIIIPILGACGTSSSTTQIVQPVHTAQDVVDKLKAIGLTINDNLPRTEGEKSLDALYKDQNSFEIVDSGTKYAGAVTICQKKSDCDGLYDNLQISVKLGLVQVWRSEDGFIICMIDSKLSKHISEQIQSIIETLKLT